MNIDRTEIEKSLIELYIKMSVDKDDFMELIQDFNFDAGALWYEAKKEELPRFYDPDR